MIGPFIDQIVGTAFPVMFVFALVDRLNQPPRANLAPLLVGLAVAAIGMSFGATAGYAINPARDFGPRVFAWLAGWGRVALPGVHDYVWVPIVGPLVGGVVGAVVYDLFIHQVLRARGEPAASEVEAEGRTVKEAETATR
jgi:glycerol uptake facilitator protein